MSSLKLTSAPAVLPVALSDAKLYSHITTTDYDTALLTPYLKSATDFCERFTSRRCITQTWIYGLDDFPYWRNRSHYQEILLPYSPVQSVSSITYYDGNGILQTLDPSQYIADNTSEPCRIMPAYNCYWPDYRRVPNGIQITFVAGYGDTADLVPPGIVEAIWLATADKYNIRSNMSEVQYYDNGRLIDLLYQYKVGYIA